MDPIVLILAAIAVLIAIFWISDNVHKANLYTSLKPRLDKLDENEAKFLRDKADWEERLKRDQFAVQQLAKEKSVGFPWLAEAYAEYFHLRDMATARYLEYKSHPAKKAADHVREIAHEKRNAEKLWRVLKYQIEYYESLFPWLIDFKGEELDDLIRQITSKTDEASFEGEQEDPIRRWLTAAEYHDLPSAQRNQLALDRYWQKKKSPWELGRDYERFIGYQYESKGWQVRYQGIIEGLADLGRDLIVTKGNTTQVVQCKYWSKYKTIHEKHIFQLYGTVIAYRIDHPSHIASGVFVTSTCLSDRAKAFASALGVAYREFIPLTQYPSIKCNVSRKDGIKIYHLPMDQQYDRTLIEEERNEYYVLTVAEAERLGFRRAYRWRGPGPNEED